MGLSQSDKIFGALLIAFVIYITVRGQLPKYLSIFQHSASNSGSSGGGIVQSVAGSFQQGVSKMIDQAAQGIGQGIIDAGSVGGLAG